VLSKQSDLNHPDAFPLVQSAPVAHYCPLADWLGRLTDLLQRLIGNGTDAADRERATTKPAAARQLICM
jgi:predicted Abi (CAAX) family protease